MNIKTLYLSINDVNIKTFENKVQIVQNIQLINN